MDYISKIKLPNNTTYSFKDSTLYYGVCNTSAATAIKEITISNFNLDIGVRIIITFTYANSAVAPALSINSGTAISFYLNYDNITLWDAGETCEFIYDGTYWNLVNYGKVEVIRL